MSTTATAVTQESHLGIPPEKAFDELVFHDPTTCSRCFSLIRKHDTYRVDVGIGGVSKHAPTERLIRWYDGEKGYKTELMDEYGYRPLYEPRTFCSDCGSQSGRADDEPLSKVQALTFTDQLVNRLRDGGVSINRDVVEYVVGCLKERAECRNYDTEIFRRAVKLGIKYARYD